MVGLRRRPKTEGWALDAAETDAQFGRYTIRQRLADSNRLWIVCLIAVVVITAIFWQTSSRGIGRSKLIAEPPPAPTEFSDPQRYAEFASLIAADKRFRESIIEAGFLTPGVFRIVVPGSTSADEVDYMSKMAAERIRTRFGHRAVVQVYMRRAADGSMLLMATTQWEPKRYGFVVKYQTGTTRAL